MKKFKNYLEIAKYLLKIEKWAYKSVNNSKIDLKDKTPDTEFKYFDIVTNYDTTIEKLLLSKLNKDFDNPKIVSEEFNSKEQAKGTYFVIDPIDGTLNFANNIDIWSVQIAYIENDEVVASAIYSPSASYFSAKGFGAYKNGKRFFVEKKPLNHLLYNIGTKYPHFNKIFLALKGICLQQRCFGVASIGLAWIAEGKLGAYIMEETSHPWDYLPGLLLTKEAGCYCETVENLIVFANSEEAFKEIAVTLKEEYSKHYSNEYSKKSSSQNKTTKPKTVAKNSNNKNKSTRSKNINSKTQKTIKK